MDREKTKEDILELARHYQGSENAFINKKACEYLGITDIVLRTCVRELFNDGHNIICMPKLKDGATGGLCQPTTEDLLLWYRYNRKRALTLLVNLRKVKKEYFKRISNQISLEL